jgi:hypothetical protein
LKKEIPEFKRACKSTYKNMSEIADHFKNWYLKKQTSAPMKDLNKTDMVFGQRKHFRK